MSSVPPVTQRPWICSPVDEALAQQFTNELNIPLTVGKVLVRRGMDSVEAAKEFLEPRWADLHDPSELPDMAEAVEMILAVRDAEGIVGVFGDYDVDGISGSAILLEVLQHLGIKTESRLPNRIREGYGLGLAAVEEFSEKEVDLIVTVDGGSNDVEAIQQAMTLGMEVIVTDHHPIRHESVDFLLVHPERPDRECRSVGLCGAGVAYKLAWAVAREVSGGGPVDDKTRDLLVEMSGFAALGTVADVVPLQGENRILVRHGMKVLQSTRRPGLVALMDLCKVDRTNITATDIGFKLGPHLNAAGRLGEAEDSLELLLTPHADRGRELAQGLAVQNRKRKEIENQMVTECIEELEAGQHPERGPLIFAREGWHTGVAGIVASRMTDKYGRPAWVLCIEDDIVRGSGRGFPEWSLAEMYPLMEPLVEKVGGHPVAGGVTLKLDQLPHLRSALLKIEENRELDRTPPPRYFDDELSVGDLKMELVQHLERLAPFGAKNREPLFKIHGLRIDGTPRLVGEGQKHVQAHFRGDGIRIPSIWFNAAGRAQELTKGGEVTLMAHLGINDFRGRHLQLRIVDCLEN